MKVLLSGLGRSDPMTEFDNGKVFDSSCLHIIRHYMPDKVYLLYSKEMCDNEEKDNRYETSIRLLCESFGKSIEIKKYLDHDLVDVFVFDIFIDYFDNIIKDIINENGEDVEILLNVSSGTPAMKSALQTLAAISKYNCVPLQVVDPTKGNKDRIVNRKDYDAKLLFSFNEDNKKGAKVRVSRSMADDLKFRIQKNSIEAFISESNYDSAFYHASYYKKYFSAEIFDLLEFAKCRSHLEMMDAKKIDYKYHFGLMPYKDSSMQIFEYALWLKYKFDNSEYLDFIRGINPFMNETFNQILIVKLNIDLKKYCTDKNNRLCRNKLASKYPDVLKILDDEFKPYKEGTLSETQMQAIIRKLVQDEELVQAVHELDELRRKIRNTVAHTITSISKPEIEKILGNKLSCYVKQIKIILKALGYNLQNWDSYEKMNKYILEKI
ncbi:CRISPR type III-A/MTUBE-associated protein Csm6 [Kandleria vitulina]|uniref:CRISPR type III-A/MTUBE-associated protein Csm6 n=1 Tax=Kandleria vitulina TaxID=1630 RepID=A0A1H2PWL6_9FIRM|nr:hypothetical protein [Kandleria vitulina]SDV99235.1 CRISPR type III-A/MTUBE-associated protein Csm6 [Kandleria vitulina]